MRVCYDDAQLRQAMSAVSGSVLVDRFVELPAPSHRVALITEDASRKTRGVLEDHARADRADHQPGARGERLGDGGGGRRGRGGDSGRDNDRRGDGDDLVHQLAQVEEYLSGVERDIDLIAPMPDLTIRSIGASYTADSGTRIDVGARIDDQHRMHAFVAAAAGPQAERLVLSLRTEKPFVCQYVQPAVTSCNFCVRSAMSAASVPGRGEKMNVYA